MKFKLLSIGQKFEYEGEVYIKTSPIIASNVESNHNKMIPRYASLTLLNDAVRQEQQIKDEPINTVEILKAFNLFYEKCITTLEKNDVLIPLIKNEMDNARDEFTRHFT